MRELFEEGWATPFLVDDMDAVFKCVAAQGRAVCAMDFDIGSFGEPPARSSAIVRDPDGNLVQIDQRGPAKRANKYRLFRTARDIHLRSDTTLGEHLPVGESPHNRRECHSGDYFRRVRSAQGPEC